MRGGGGGAGAGDGGGGVLQMVVKGIKVVWASVWWVVAAV